MTEVRFGQAINRALIDAMTQDSSVVLFGEDVAEAGGPFGVTRGLLKKFGGERVRDTPISEAAIVGVAHTPFDGSPAIWAGGVGIANEVSILEARRG